MAENCHRLLLYIEYYVNNLEASFFQEAPGVEFLARMLVSSSNPSGKKISLQRTVSHFS